MLEQEFKLKKISQAELDEILEQHALWVANGGQKGIHANLSFCDLRGLEFPIRVNLFRANLWRVHLNGTNLMEANLVEANLVEANLMGVNLMDANLVKAKLIEANLMGANLMGANLVETNLMGANLTETDLAGALGVLPHHIRLTTNINLEEQTIQQQLKINQLEQKLQKVQAENNQSQEQKEKIVQLEQELQQAKQAKQELEQLKQISNAHQALTKALTNTETQIDNNQNFSKSLGEWALGLIILDIVYVVCMPFAMIDTKFYDLMANKVGIWAILFLTFPALMILLIALSLLRHQKQLIAEIRHYSMLKHKIELYGGILKASQYIAFAQNSTEDNYIKDTFNEIKTELLKSPNFDLNSQPQIFPEENMLMSAIEKAIEKLGVEFVKKNTETTGKS